MIQWYKCFTPKITINLRDFNLADNTKIEIITPKDFVSKYL